MVFERIVGSVLKSFLGKFITGIDNKNLSLGIWSGSFEILNVEINPEVLGMIDFPI